MRGLVKVKSTHQARIRKMWLGTHLECVRSSPRVLGACKDGAREFAGRRLRLTERLSGDWTIWWELSGSSLGLRQDFTEGIGKIARNTSGDRQRKTIRLVVGSAGGCQITGVRS
ncbi:hypothetical protein BHE74_00056448 [Ensete ventricosum]|nr:hypothetical protein BHE74_00056448 [Ensete ventricosum]